jgi:hypothetical protein
LRSFFILYLINNIAPRYYGDIYAPPS